MISSENKTIEVYVELLDEGTTTWRPTQAKALGDGLYTLLSTPDYDPEDEIWAFLPGEQIRLENKTNSSGRTILVARHPDTNAIRINVPCDDVFAIRTTNALSIGNGVYKILPTPHYDAGTERWRFPPGSLVRVEKKSLDGIFTSLVAVAPES